MCTAEIFRVAEDLTEIIDSDSVGDGKAGVKGNERIQVNQPAVTIDKGNVLPWPERMIALNRKESGPDNLCGAVDSGGQVPRGGPRESSNQPWIAFVGSIWPTTKDTPHRAKNGGYFQSS